MEERRMTIEEIEALTKARKEQFRKFSAELEKLSLKYQITLTSCGGVDFYDPDDEKLVGIEYSADPTSGDLNIYSTRVRDMKK